MKESYGSTTEEAGRAEDRLSEILAEEGSSPTPSASDPRRGMQLQHHQKRHHRRGLSYDQRPTSFRRRPSASFRQQQHRRRRTTSLSEFLVDVGQEAQSEWTTVSQTLVEELNEYDQGRKTYNMDMALVRSLSVLPDDLMDFAHETVYLGEVGEDLEELPEDEQEPATGEWATKSNPAKSRCTMGDALSKSPMDRSM